MYFESDPYSYDLTESESFINTLDSGLAKNPSGTARMLVIYQTAWTLWLHQNSRAFQNKPLRFAPQINDELAIARLEDAFQYSSSHKRSDGWQKRLLSSSPALGTRETGALRWSATKPLIGGHHWLLTEQSRGPSQCNIVSKNSKEAGS